MTLYHLQNIIQYNISSSKMKPSSSKKIDKYQIKKIENRELQKKSETNTDITHASQRSYKFASVPVTKHLNLEVFKLNPCNNPKHHNPKHCVNYHNQKDRKRYGEQYSQNMCEYIENGQKCPYGDACTNAHSRVQQLYQQQTYKKKFCSHYPNNTDKCQYGQYCSFGHNEEQVLVDLIHNYEEDEDFYMFFYKTIFCPFNLTEHDKSLCVYAHNWQDYRRSPNFYNYQPISCYNWKLKDYIVDYTSGCENGILCTMCHGWKQLHYHPSVYRTNKCQEQACKKGLCPNYHSQKEKRVISNQITLKHFKIVARNRIVEGVFKSDTRKMGFKPKEGFKSQCHSMFDKIAQTGEKVENNSEQKKKICWVNKINQMIDSEEEDEDINGKQVNSQVDKVLEGQ